MSKHFGARFPQAGGALSGAGGQCGRERVGRLDERERGGESGERYIPDQH
jgi:hypothetical protein